MAGPDSRMPGGGGVSLGILGVSERLNRLSPGMLYAIAFDQQPLRLALAGRALMSSLGSGRPCTAVSALEPRMFLRKLEMLGLDLGEFADSGLLTLHRQRADLTIDTPSSRTRSALHEWRQLKCPQGSLVILDHADERFSLADASAASVAVQTCQDWATQGTHTVLATFMPKQQAPREYATLRALSEQFGGFAIARTTDDDAQLEVRHWFGAPGTLTRSTFELTCESGGQIRGRPAAATPKAMPDPTRERQVVTRRAAEGFEASAGWQVVGSLLEALDRARSMEGGTLVIHFDRTSSLRELCQAVALLRGLGRPQLRVVVRECGARLRLPQMVALLRLGASAVIPRAVSGQAARVMAEALRGSLFNRPFAADVDEVLGDTGADHEGTVLAVDDFGHRVRRLLCWADESGLTSTLVRFTPASPQALRVALSALRRGARDCLFSQHDGSVWVLLFGCALQDSDRVLSRLLGPRYENLLTDLQRTDDSAQIVHTLRLLEHAVVDPADAVFADTVTRAHGDFGIEVRAS